MANKNLDQEKFRSIRKEILIQLFFFFGLFRSILALSLRGVLCPSDWLTITGPCQWFNVSVEMLLLAVVVILFILELVWNHNWKEFTNSCKTHWPVFIFIIFSGLSFFWSIQSNITLYKFLVLLSSSIIAIYIGRFWGLEKLVRSLTWFFALISLASLCFVMLLPQISIMPDPFYKGAWNGIFWHRNYLGCFMALGIGLFLVNLLASRKPRRGFFYFNLVMIILSTFLLIKSKSATGIISSMVLVTLVLVLYTWIKLEKRLKKLHYFLLLAVIIAAATILFTNLDFFLGLLGRNSSLTGRVPMWEYVFQHVVKQRIWLGYGYGAIWHLAGFREELAQILHWGAPVLIGDNGFFDILIHLGIVGVFMLLVLIILGFIRAIKFFLKERTINAAFPILIMVFGIVANISLSLILETESLVWIIALSILVSLVNHSQTSNIPIHT